MAARLDVGDTGQRLKMSELVVTNFLNALRARSKAW
jgi:hypothetical protein